MKYTEEDILKSKTPMEYIDRCLNCNIRKGEKATLSKNWQERTGYTVKDIAYARHRHPYWKRRKLEGNLERTKQRMAIHNYISEHKYMWPDSQIKQFLRINTKKDGKFVYKDFEIAKMLKTSIAGVQAWRRKVHLINRLFELLKTRSAKRDEFLIPLMRSSETHLREELYEDKPSISNILKRQRNRK